MNIEYQEFHIYDQVKKSCERSNELIIELVRLIDHKVSSGESETIHDAIAELANILSMYPHGYMVWEEIRIVCKKHSKNFRFCEDMIVTVFEPFAIWQDSSAARIMLKMICDPDVADIVYSAYDHDEGDRFPQNIITDYQKYSSGTDIVHEMKSFPFHTLSEYMKTRKSEDAG